GKYRVEIERAPELSHFSEAFALAAGRTKKFRVELNRLVDMPAKGWWPGELHVHRPLEDIELLMRAEELHVAPVITWWNRRNLWERKQLPADPLVRCDGTRFYHVLAGEDERTGGALLYFNLRHPLAIASASNEYPSPLQYVPA